MELLIYWRMFLANRYLIHVDSFVGLFDEENHQLKIVDALGGDSCLLTRRLFGFLKKFSESTEEMVDEGDDEG